MAANDTYKLGFGVMRLPKTEDGKTDRETFCQLIDEYMAGGFNYFDTARGYMNGDCEQAVRDCLVDRYPRDSYILTAKLSEFHFKSEAEAIEVFNDQLRVFGVDYFDYYLMHSQTSKRFEYYKKHHAYEHALKMLEEGKIKHFGISFHDKANVLEQILTEYPQIEVVQMQLNYMDYEDPAIQSRAVYEVAERFGKKVFVMEPCKGGHLARFPKEARVCFDELGDKSSASYAMRFAAGHKNVEMVLSGMRSLEDLRDNMATLKNPEPLTKEELEAIDKVTVIYKALNAIPCTACRYCVEVCPKDIPIPELFACMNDYRVFKDWHSEFYYRNLTGGHGKASDCLKCGKCEKVCPQGLKIRDLLVGLKAEFEDREWAWEV